MLGVSVTPHPPGGTVHLPHGDDVAGVESPRRDERRVKSRRRKGTAKHLLLLCDGIILGGKHTGTHGEMGESLGVIRMMRIPGESLRVRGSREGLSSLMCAVVIVDDVVCLNNSPRRTAPPSASPRRNQRHSNTASSNVDVVVDVALGRRIPCSTHPPTTTTSRLTASSSAAAGDRTPRGKRGNGGAATMSPLRAPVVVVVVRASARRSVVGRFLHHLSGVSLLAATAGGDRPLLLLLPLRC